jgi:hypothetical protein
MTDVILLMCVPTTILLALAIDAMIALELIWRFFISLQR